MDVAVLGVGIMGAPMARRLAQAGFRVRAWNRTADKAVQLVSDAISAHATPREAATGADVVLAMLSTGDVVDQALFDAETGAAGALAAGATVIVSSSIPVAAAQRQAERLAARDIGYIDAPVSGGERGAIAGTLAIMAGGEAAAVERMAPVFAPLGRVTHVGPAGSGQLAKLANQLIVGVTIGAVAEALILAEAGGARLDAVRTALSGGFADSTVLRQHGERMIEGNFKPGAHAKTQLKDLSTARALAETYKLDLPLTALAEQLYARMCSGPFAEHDHSALFLALKAWQQA